MIKQRTPEWFEQRLGRFTASNIHKLLSDGKTKGSFGADFYSICFEKAREKVFGRDESWDITSWDMRRGTELEPEAFAFFQAIMARKFIHVQEATFFPHGDNAGASPDGLVGSNATLQIKCPRPEKVDLLIRDGIKAIDKQYIEQMQMEMLSTNSELCYFFMYCLWNGKPHYHTIEVPRDQSIIDKINERLPYGVKQRDEYAEQLLTNKQF